MSIRVWESVAIATLLFGSASPLLAASNVRSCSIVCAAPVDGADGNAPRVATATSPRNDAAIGSRRLPRQAPVDHRQPKIIDIPQNTGLPQFEAEQRRLDAELDKRLVICRGC
jgi:hypothetical protein